MGQRGTARLTAALAFATAACLALVGCSGESETEGNVDSITIAAEGIPTAWSESAVLVAGKYDYLINTQANLIQNAYVTSDDGRTLVQDLTSFEGELAESYDVSEDGTVYTFHLRQGVMSAEGNELTADDVVWSWERKFGHDLSSAPAIQRPVITDPDQVTKIDDYTVEFRIPEAGYGLTLLALLSNTTGWIYDSDLLKEHATPEDPFAVEWTDSQWETPWGFGPYVVSEVQEDTQMVLTANPGFWSGEPAIKKVVYRTVSDPGTRATALSSGEVDAALGLRPVDSSELGESSDVWVPENTFSNQFLMMPLVNNKAPFDNADVRRAFAYAVPYQQIIDSVYYGRATKPERYLNSTTPSPEDAALLPAYDYDPEKAHELLRSAGFDNVEFTLTYASESPDVADAAVQIQNYAEEAGFTVTLNEVPVAAFNQGRSSGDFQALLIRDQSFVLAPTYEMNVFFGPDASANWALWKDASFSAAIDAAVAVGDPATPEGATAWNDAERILLDQVPNVFIAKTKASWAVADELEGVAYRTDQVVDWSTVRFK
ncbi:ABC transporter substrate-binding protein [Microbacterium soli]|uniref:ABC transporter substrate-binding protein n=1 Tax=Microbacterium soli TaxID=446075 RepID=A0ABP7MZR7_9MICO